MLTDKELVFELCSRNDITLIPVTPYEDAKESFSPDDSSKVQGYVGFFIVFSFNEDGSLHSIGAWE